MGSCQPDGATIPMLLILGVFIASMAGLFSKDKDSRRNALIVGMGISFGLGLVYLFIGCSGA